MDASERAQPGTGSRPGRRATTAGQGSDTPTAGRLRISAADAKARVDAGAAIVIDTDPPRGAAAPVAVAGALRVPPDEVARRYTEFPRGCAVVAYCT